MSGHEQTTERQVQRREKADAAAQAEADYRATHSADGYSLGSAAYPDNREGRRALARSWKRYPRRARS